MRFFPTAYLFNVILKATNTNLDNGEIEITKGEMLRFIGIWFFMDTTSGFPCQDYFSEKEVNVYSGSPYCVHMWMSCNQFGSILRALTLTLSPPPSFQDRFWQVRGLIHTWNKDMEEVFRCGWITCLDESISI